MVKKHHSELIRFSVVSVIIFCWFSAPVVYVIHQQFNNHVEYRPKFHYFNAFCDFKEYIILLTVT
jgi:hypothetical protein